MYFSRLGLFINFSNNVSNLILFSFYYYLKIFYSSCEASFNFDRLHVFQTSSSFFHYKNIKLCLVLKYRNVVRIFSPFDHNWKYSIYF